MRILIAIGLVVCLTQFGCNSSSNVNVPTDNQTIQDGPSGAAASFTILKSGLKLTADASAVNGSDTNNTAILVRWDWTNDGTWDTDWSSEKIASNTYEEGSYFITMQMKDADGRTDSATKHFTIAQSNKSPTAAFAVNMVNGMTVSVDASSSSDTEDSTSDLQFRWDWNNDGTFDTEWTSDNTTEHTYDVAGEYTIKLEVKDLNNSKGTKTQTVIASPIAIRSSFLTLSKPYHMKINFRLINNLTGQPVQLTDQPKLDKGDFQIYEDSVLLDPAETGQYLSLASRPMHLVLVLDFTGSMMDSSNNGLLDSMIKSAKWFINNQTDNTYISLWAFWDRPAGYKWGVMEVADFTRCNLNGQSELINKLDNTAKDLIGNKAGGVTTIWDVLYRILKSKFPDFDNGVNRAIVFLSDGHDTSSKKTVSNVIDVVKKGKAVNIFSVGLALRQEDYPADEPNMKKIADETGGIYFTVNQDSDLSTVFEQIAQDLDCDWTLSYITPKQTGSHNLLAKCNYLSGIASTTIDFTVKKEIIGDLRKGLISVKPVTTATGTEYAVQADYVPRNMRNADNISFFKIHVTSTDPTIKLSLYDNNALCTPGGEWSINQEADGWYTISSSPTAPFEDGSFGRIAKCTLDSENMTSVFFELPAPDNQTTLYVDDKRFVFRKNENMALIVPYFMTGIAFRADNGTLVNPAVALHGTPAYPAQPSINVGQTFTVIGQGLTLYDSLILNTISNTGDWDLIEFSPSSANGTSMQVTFPPIPSLPWTVTTSNAFLYAGFTDYRVRLQIVPHLTGPTTGTGFVEGGMKAVVIGVNDNISYTDSGIETSDGIDVTGSNTYFSFNSLIGNSTPVYVITDGGTSEIYGP